MSEPDGGPCGVCGKPLPVQTGPGARRKYHATCRPPRVDRRNRRAPLLGLASARVARLTGRPRRTMVEAVTAEMDAAGQLDTPDGVAALMLAEQVDAGRYGASAARPLHEALRAARAAALAHAKPKADVVDLIFGAEPGGTP